MIEKLTSVRANFRKFLCLFVSLYFVFSMNAQILKPGFNPNEYSELLRITARQRGPISDTLYPAPLKYDLAYTSPSVGMDNGWQLWVPKKGEAKVGVISLRATTSAHSSWAENLYSAMVAAKGSIKINDSFTFNYKLAENTKANIHVGWLIGTAFIQKDIQPKMDSLYQKGYKDFIIFGHSQGGALSYLLTSYYHYQQEQGKLPKDITFKTYGSAAPKPGNLYYAYDYEDFTQKGWGYNVVNTSDWVPETPPSVQTNRDFVNSNPFKYTKQGTKNLSFLKRIVVRSKMNGIDRKFNRARKKFNKIMGKQFEGIVKSYLPDLQKEVQLESLNYQRCGNQISLLANDQYYDYFIHDNKNVFRNHMMDAYQILLEIHYGKELDPEYIIYTNKKFPFYLKPKIPTLHKDK